MNIGEHLNRYRVLSPEKSGPNSPITEARLKTAELLGKSIEQICGLTSGWSKDQVHSLYREAIIDGKNPAKFWWYLYKKRKVIYGKTKKTNTRGLRKVGKKSRRDKQEERQGILFGDR